MIVRMASSDEEIHCGYQHESKTRTLVDKLLQVDEVNFLQDKTGKDSDRDDDLDELITGWRNSFLLLKYPSASRRNDAKRKFSKSLGAEVIQTEIAVRCINEDFSSDHYKSPWKASVEPGTYRYIVNNGYYRTAKFSATGRSWVTAKRSRKPERGSMSNNEIKRAQKSLKRDLDFRFGQNHDSRSQSDEIGSSSEGNTVHDEIPHGGNTTAGDDHGLNASLVPRTVYVDVNADAFHHIHRVESAPNLSSKNSADGGRARFREDGLLHENAPNFQAPYRSSQSPFTTATFLRAESTLRPLEKLTPQQKMIERRASESEKHSSIACNAQTSFIATRNGLILQPAAHNSKNPFSDWPKTDIYNGNVDNGLALLSYLKKGAAASGGGDAKSVKDASASKPTTNDLSRILRETSKVLKSTLANGIANHQAAAQKRNGQGYKYFGSQSNGALGGFLGSNLASNADKAANSGSDQFGIGNALPLPEISGKRIMMESHQRTL
ncbi:unnamed protein product [Lymnaea stagnalis]|uniref:Uncharacterized protein n=1 Tax=Lymnaea stagnalis TaxID=6523 RepID=A0AAV2I5T8_LYMST